MCDCVSTHCESYYRHYDRTPASRRVICCEELRRDVKRHAIAVTFSEWVGAGARPKSQKDYSVVEADAAHLNISELADLRQNQGT
jgi:hypothetical protein